MNPAEKIKRANEAREMGRLLRSGFTPKPMRDGLPPEAYLGMRCEYCGRREEFCYCVPWAL